MSIFTSKLLPVVRLGIAKYARPHPLASYFSRRYIQEFPEMKLNNKLHQDYVLVLPEPLNEQPDQNEALKIPKAGEPEIDFTKIDVESIFKALSQTVGTFEDFLTDVNNVDVNSERSAQEFFKDIEKHLVPMDCAYNILSLLMNVDKTHYLRKEIFELMERYAQTREKRLSGNFGDVIQDYQFRNYSKLSDEDKRMMQFYHVSNVKRNSSRTLVDDSSYLSYKKHLRVELVTFQQNLAEVNQLFSHTVDDPDILAVVTPELDQGTNLHHKERTPLKVTTDKYHKFMQTCPDRFVRQMLWQTYNKRCSPKGLPKFNNASVISNIRVWRRKMADILGYRTHVESKLTTCLLSTRQQVLENLRALNEENSAILMDRLQELNDYAIDNSFQDSSRLGVQEYDIDFWSHKYMYEILIGKSEQELKTYFPLDKVLKGMKNFFRNYFEIELKLKSPQEKIFWAPEVQVLDVLKKDQSLGSIIYDPYNREAKRMNDNFYGRIRGRSSIYGTAPCRLVSTSYNLDQLTKQAHLSVVDVINLFYCYGLVIQRLLYNHDYYELNTYGCLENEVIDMFPNLCVAYLLTDYRILQSCSDRGSSKTIDAELSSRILKAFTHFKSLETWRDLYKAHLDLEAHTVLNDIKSIVDEIYPIYSPFSRGFDNFDYCAMEDIFVGPKDGLKFADIVSKQLASFCLSQARAQSKNGDDLEKLKQFNVDLLDNLFDPNNFDSSARIQSLVGRSFESAPPTLGVL